MCTAKCIELWKNFLSGTLFYLFYVNNIYVSYFILIFITVIIVVLVIPALCAIVYIPVDTDYIISQKYKTKISAFFVFIIFRDMYWHGFYKRFCYYRILK